MTKVKICGITNKKDALDAVSFGADFIGLNFYEKSPRYITTKKAKEIITALPKKVKTVGVFVNSTPKKEKEISDELNLDFVQLSGDECVMHMKDLKRMGKNTIKTLHVKKDGEIDEKCASDADFILLDSKEKKLYGGTGKTFDWNKAKSLKKKIFLAGGLNVNNVKDAIKTVNPYAVDVCSGIEKGKGIKDTDEMKEFIKNVKG